MDKCEICYEQYDEDENMNKPYCLFPCGHTFCLNCIELSENKLCSKCRTPFTVIAPNWSLIERIHGELTNDKAHKLLSKASSMIEEFGDNGRKLNNLNKIKLSKIKDEINARELFLLQQMKNSKMKFLKLVEDYERENEEDFNRNSEKKDEFVKKFEEFERTLNSNAELVSTVIQIKMQMGNLKEANRLTSSHSIEEKYSFKVNNEPDNYSYGQLFSNENSKYLSYSFASEQNSKLFVLYNEKNNGVLDQDRYGYFRQYYPTSHFDNEYVRWKFIEKQNYFLIQNPKSGKYLCSGNLYHSVADFEVSESDSIKWNVRFLKVNDKDSVILKSLFEMAFLSSEQYKRYRPGYSNSKGYHMDRDTTTDHKSNPYLIWQLLEIPFDKLATSQEQHQANVDEQENNNVYILEDN